MLAWQCEESTGLVIRPDCPLMKLALADKQGPRCQCQFSGSSAWYLTVYQRTVTSIRFKGFRKATVAVVLYSSLNWKFLLCYILLFLCALAIFTDTVYLLNSILYCIVATLYHEQSPQWHGLLDLQFVDLVILHLGHNFIFVPSSSSAFNIWLDDCTTWLFTNTSF